LVQVLPRIVDQSALEELPLECIEQPVLILASGSDRRLPSVAEAQLLAKYLPKAKTTLLPKSGHACLLEKEVKLHSLLRSQDFLFA